MCGTESHDKGMDVHCRHGSGFSVSLSCAQCSSRTLLSIARLIGPWLGDLVELALGHIVSNASTALELAGGVVAQLALAVSGGDVKVSVSKCRDPDTTLASISKFARESVFCSFDRVLYDASTLEQ